jgi:ribosomal subunit interface protein
MKLTPQITFRNLEPSAAIEGNIQKHIAKLDTFYDRIMDCRVMVEVPHRHHRKGHLYHLRIDLTVPGGELVVNRDPPEHQVNEDIYVAIRDAFNSAERELRHYAERQRGDIKTHEVPPHGRISALFPDEGYGFIEDMDGQEVYFHPNSVLNADFSQLEVGQEVRFAAETGDQGTQASTVSVIGKHHLQN